MYPVGKILILAGAALIIIGLAAMGKLGPLGRLPGDIYISRPGFKFYFPITTGIIISVILTILIWLFRR